MQPTLSRRTFLGLSPLTAALAHAAPPSKTTVPFQGNRITWLGFSTVRIDTALGQTILIDPWLTLPGCPLKVDDVTSLHALLITHGHWQHVGEAVALHKKTRAPVVAVEEVAAWMTTQGVAQPPKVNVGGTLDLGAGIKVSVTAAVHSSGLLDRETGFMGYGGDPAGFVVHLPGGLRVYHAGDTDVFGDMALIRRRWSPQVGILPVGDITTMGPEGAALACELLGLQAVIPMHYDLPGFTGTVDAFARELSARNIPTTVLRAQRGVPLG